MKDDFREVVRMTIGMMILILFVSLVVILIG